MICFGAIAPHGELQLAPELLDAMLELGRRLDTATADAVVVVTPHNVHVEGHFAVCVAARAGKHEVDRVLADAIVGHAQHVRLPAVRVSYGGNDPADAELPLDWGTEIPLEHLPAKRVVVVSPARERPLAEHVRLGEAIAAASGGRRVALVASADHAHTHQEDGPYGFSPAAAAYDALLQEILATGPLAFQPLVDHVGEAKADSLWQLLVLQGAVGADPAVDVLAYAAPTYYGMLVAAVTPREAGGAPA